MQYIVPQQPLQALAIEILINNLGDEDVKGNTVVELQGWKLRIELVNMYVQLRFFSYLNKVSGDFGQNQWHEFVNDILIAITMQSQLISKAIYGLLTSPKNEQTNLFFYPDNSKILETWISISFEISTYRY